MAKIKLEERIIEELSNEENSVIDRYISISQNCLTDYLSLRIIIEISADVELTGLESDEKNSEVRELANKYLMLLKELVATIARANMTAESFYEKLYKVVFQEDLFPVNDREKGIILFFLAQRVPGLPYYQAHEPVILEDEEFRHIINVIRDELNKAVYMMTDRFDSRTEMTSQLCDIADSLETREQKAVFWACILHQKRSKSEDSN